MVRGLDQLFFELEGLLEMAELCGAKERAPVELALFRTRFDAIRAMVEGRDLPDRVGTELKPDLVVFEARFRESGL